MILDGRYRVLETIAETTRGAVYLTEHELIRRRLVVKLLAGEALPDQIARFVGEAEAAGRLHHPNIVESVDMGYLDGRPYVVLEHLQGTPLAEEIVRLGRLPIRRAVHVARQVASALHAAHLEGIVHGGLDADHVYLVDRETDPDFVKVLGLGRGARETHPEVLAPERVLGGAIDARTDVWTLGILLYQMVMGRRPFSADSGTATARRRIVSASPPTIDRPDASPELVSVILACLAKEPDQRLADMSEVDRALAAFDVRIARGSATTIPPLPSLARMRRPSSPQAGSALPARESVRMPSPVTPTSTTDSSIEVEPLLPPPRMAPAHARLLLAGAAVALALCGAGIWIAATGPSAKTTPATAAASSPVAAVAGALPGTATEAPATAPASIDITVESDVPGARVTFRRRISALPFSLETSAIDVVELMEVSAPGHKTVRYWITFDRPTHLRPALVKGAGLVDATELETLVALGEADADAGADAVTDAAAAAPAPAPVAVASAGSPVAKPAARVERDRTATRRATRRSIGKAQAPAAPAEDAPADAPTGDDKAVRDHAVDGAQATAPDRDAFAVRDPSGGAATPAPPAPAPSARPRQVAAGFLEANRIGGSTRIAPDNATRQAMRHSGVTRAAGKFTLCASAEGEVASVAITTSTGFDEYDDLIVRQLRAWRFKPISIAGAPTSVCTTVAIAYTQE